MGDIVRTRIMVRESNYCEEVSQAHGWVFKNAGVLPANTLVVSGLIGEEMLVEIEAEAEVGCSNGGVVRVNNEPVAKTTRVSPTDRLK